MKFVDHNDCDAKPLSDFASLKLTLETSSLRIGEAVKAEALDAYTCMMRARAEWLRRMNRRLPHPDVLDRQRYARPARRETRNG